VAILVTGATGTVGKQVLNFLDGEQADVRALTRTPDKAKFPTGVTAVQGDLADIDRGAPRLMVSAPFSWSSPTQLTS
jgi:uncharacterized protein YbjT (DUF2867 family)